MTAYNCEAVPTFIENIIISFLVLAIISETPEIMNLLDHRSALDFQFYGFCI